MMGSQTNLCYNCVDRHVAAGRGEETALIWESNEGDENATFTFNEVSLMVQKCANMLKAGPP